MTLQFLLAGGIILIAASITIYLFSSNFRKNDFGKRLSNYALITASLFFTEYEVDAERFLKYEKEDTVNLNNERILVLNSKRDTIYNSDNEKVIRAGSNIVDQVMAGSIYSSSSGKYEIVGIRYFTNYDIFTIFAAATDDEGYVHLQKVGILLIVVTAISLLLFFVVGWFSSAKAIKPLSDVVEKVEDISATSLDLRIDLENPKDEIGRLATTFNKMLERLEVSFAGQKAFIANASHEMRTPLTAIYGQLEVLLLKERTDNEYRKGIESVLVDILSLIELLNRLLLLARTSAVTPANHNKKLRIDEIVWQIREDFKKINKNYIVNISLDVTLTDADQMVVYGDEYLLKMAISNIVDNACKYSGDKTVDIRLNPSDNFLNIEFRDNGIGISEEGLSKVFEPFHRDDNTFPSVGHGIGLTLANQIIKNHNGEICLTSELGKGTCVIIRLPVV